MGHLKPQKKRGYTHHCDLRKGGVLFVFFSNGIARQGHRSGRHEPYSLRRFRDLGLREGEGISREAAETRNDRRNGARGG